MKLEDYRALRFILQDDIYLLDQDKLDYMNPDNRQVPAIQPEQETSKVVFNYLGTNKRGFLILTHYADEDFIADEHLVALERVLAARNHTREDVAIVNTAKNIPEYLKLISQFNPQTILILGQESIPVGADHLKFNQVEKREGITVLCTFSFKAMMTNTDCKKAFWEQVKTL